MAGIFGGLIGSKSALDIPRSGIQLYLDASNPSSYSGSGNTWFDLSGNNRNFSWNTPSFNPTGIKYFNTQGKLATGPASNSFGVNNTSGYTIFLTMFQNSLAESAAFKWHSSNGVAANETRGIFSHCTWSDGSIYWDQGGCCALSQRTNVALISNTGTWHVIAFRNNYSGTNRTIWRNNSILTTNSSAIANINLSATAANVGGASDEYGPDSAWNARIGQFAMYNRSLSDTEMTEVYQSFRAKVGI